MKRSITVVLTVVGVAAFALSACGDKEGPTGSRPVTDGEASRMAEALFNDYDIGGADFTVNAQMPDGTTVFMSGEVDWRSHSGRADVRIDGTADAAVTEVMWSAQVVLERIPALTELAATLGRSATEFSARPPDSAGRHLDSMIQLVTSLGAEQRDNPVLIAQTPGTEWLRSDEIPGTGITADVLRYGDRTVYWLDEGGVTLYRFEGNNAQGTRPVLVDLRSHGRREIALPSPDDVGDSLALGDLYEAVTGTPPG